MNNPRRDSRTAAAIAARQEKTTAALQRVDDAVARMRREKSVITVAGVARRAGVSRTFLYENPAARTAVSTTRTAAAADREKSIQRITTENTTLKQRVREPTRENHELNERPKAARSNVRFRDRRIAELEVKLRNPVEAKL